MRTVIALLALSLAAAPGCGKKSNDTSTGSAAATGSAMAGSGSAAGSGSDMAAGSGSAGSGSGSAMAGSGSAAGSGSDMAAGSGSAGSGSAGSGSDAQVMAHHAGNCPSTVLGSKTATAVKGKAVEVKITSDDPDAVLAIQKRTELLLADQATRKDTNTHDQKGGHGGSMGLCPVHVPDGAKATWKKLDGKGGGALVTITPKDDPAAFKKDLDARVEKAAAWVKENIHPGDKGNQGGVGGGKVEEGMNHSGLGDGHGADRKAAGGTGSGGGKGTGGGGGKGTGGGNGKGSGK